MKYLSQFSYYGILIVVARYVPNLPQQYKSKFKFSQFTCAKYSISCKFFVLICVGKFLFPVMKKYFYILFFSSICYAQTDIKSIKFTADSLFESGDFFEAITEYKRLKFFDKQFRFSYVCNYRIGLCYKEGAKFENALSYLTKAFISSENEEEKIAAREQMIRINILRRTTARAHYLLDELAENPEYEKNNVHYWRGWIYMFEDDWENAGYEFEKIDINHPLKIICERVNSEKYSVTLAKIFSLVLPGSGQFYTGNYLSGLMSLGWNVLWGYTTIKAFSNNRIFDGVIIGDLLWLRFYRGNYQNAENFAQEKNLGIINKTYNYLQNSYEGIKP